MNVCFRAKPLGRALVLLLVLASFASAAEPFRFPTERELRQILKPHYAGQVALSPDGRYLAYTVHETVWLSLVILDTEDPKNKVTLQIGQDRWAASGGTIVPAQVTFMKWASPNRLAFSTRTAGEPDDLGSFHDEIRAVDADGGNDMVLLKSRDLEEAIWPENPNSEAPPMTVPRRGRILDLDPGHPDSILVEATGGVLAPSELFRVDLRTGKYRSLSAQPERGETFYDRQGRPRFWLSASTLTQALPTPPSSRAPTSDLGGEGDEGGGPQLRPLPPMPFQAPSVHSRTVPRRLYYREPEGSKRWRDFDQLLGHNPSLFGHASETVLGERAVPLAFDADPNILYFASNAGRDTYAIYALDLRTRQRTEFAVEDPDFDVVVPRNFFGSSPLVFDRTHRLVGVRLAGARAGKTRWLDPELARHQADLEDAFRDRTVRIADWDDARRRFLVHVDSLDQPGRYFIYQPERPDGFTEIIRRASWLPATAAHSTTSFAFETSAGIRLSGWLTLPRHQPLSSAPLVVYCHNLPGGRPEPGLNTEVHALARMGFAVARIHYRGTAGLGRKHQEAIKAGIDTVPIADIRAAVAWLAANKNINPRRVALLGQGFGGYLAARALQLHPEEFRCAIAINAPTDLARWMQDRGNASAPPPALLERQAFFDHPHTPLSAISLTREPELFRRPLFLLQDVERRDLGEAHGRRLLEALRKRRIEAQYLALSTEFSHGDPAARALAFKKIGDFLNEHVLSYKVELGETQEVQP